MLLETPEIIKRANRHSGGDSLAWGRCTVASLDLLIDETNFAFYNIKIQLETSEMKFSSVALLSQAKKSECGTAQPSSKHLVG